MSKNISMAAVVSKSLDQCSQTTDSETTIAPQKIKFVKIFRLEVTLYIYILLFGGYESHQSPGCLRVGA